MDDRSNVLSTSEQSLSPTRKRGVWSSVVKTVLMSQQPWPEPVRLGFVLMLIVLVMLLVGCGTPLPPPSEGPRNPSPPPISEPLPSESYLSKAQRLIESWRNAVTGM